MFGAIPASFSLNQLSLKAPRRSIVCLRHWRSLLRIAAVSLTSHSKILQTRLFAAVVAISPPFVRSSRLGESRIYVGGSRRSSFAPVCALSALLRNSLSLTFLSFFFLLARRTAATFFVAVPVFESMNPFLLPGANPLSRLRPDRPPVVTPSFHMVGISRDRKTTFAPFTTIGSLRDRQANTVPRCDCFHNDRRLFFFSFRDAHSTPPTFTVVKYRAKRYSSRRE